MRVMIFLFAMSLFLASCGKKESVKPPEGVLSYERMEEVLYDVQIVEAVYQRSGKTIKNEAGIRYARSLYGQVFDKHNITRGDFERSFQWYSRHPQILTDIYDNILTRMSEQQAVLNEREGREEGEVQQKDTDTIDPELKRKLRLN